MVFLHFLFAMPKIFWAAFNASQKILIHLNLRLSLLFLKDSAVNYFCYMSLKSHYF